MFLRLLKKFRKPSIQDNSHSIPEGQRVYCIGDIHGRADLLTHLHEIILKDAIRYQGNKTIVYLGDYIDRGEQSRQVIEMLLSQPLPGFKAIYLKGNHEQAMLDFMEYPEAAAAWLTFGGREALNSYGIQVAYIPTLKEVPSLAERLRQELPDSHWNFLQNNLFSWQCGDYYFVHAGIRPGVALEKQVPEDQLWIRDEFLESKRDHGAIIVHGHSITPEPEFLKNRIGIDTSAYNTGILTCLVLQGYEKRLLQTGIA
jgi:serine/threonine protein phosphatase 1